MRFGHFFYPMCLDRDDETAAIENCLYEAELVEELGWDAVWIAEHHFSGEVVYGDSMVLGGALAARTKRVSLGFGVLEMALHHPVRVAIQTALLDQLSHGRLIVGIGRGSNYNSFEYAGFGTSVSTGLERLDEAEDLLVKAWTTENLDYKGKYWQVRFPSIRPRPYQKPHPPIARACVSTDSVVKMASIGRPVLLRGRSAIQEGEAIQLYRDTMLSAGFDEPAVDAAVDQSWLWKELYVAETDEKAFDEFLPALERNGKFLRDIREEWNPADQPMPKGPPPVPRSAYGEHADPNANEVLVGSPRRVAEQVALLTDGGIRNLMLTHRGLMSQEKATRSLKLFSEEVIPLFR